jgi:hypothetical protein
MFGSFIGQRSSSQITSNAASSDSITEFKNADYDEKQEITRAIETANSMLVRAHRSLPVFFSLPKVDQMNFIGELSARATVSERTNHMIGIGYDMYKTFLVANIEQDRGKLDRILDAIR